jgi:hypothetical protein
MQVSKHGVALTRCFPDWCDQPRRIPTVRVSTAGWPRPHIDVVSVRMAGVIARMESTITPGYGLEYGTEGGTPLEPESSRSHGVRD